MQLTDLPDDALVRVLALLSVRELLQTRTVCRRLRDVVLHADLWRRREAVDHDESNCLRHSNKDQPGQYEDSDEGREFKVALRLAPCVDRMVITRSRSLALAETTGCAAAALHLRLRVGTGVPYCCWSYPCSCSEPEVDAERGLQLLLNQLRLGRLRSLSLQMNLYGDERPAWIGGLLRQVDAIQGLNALSVVLRFSATRTWQQQMLARPAGPLVSVPLPAAALEVPAALLAPSLRELRLRSASCRPWEEHRHPAFPTPDPRPGPWPTVSFQLASHAATLQVVHLDLPPHCHVDVSLLAALPLLRELGCPLLPGMAALARCPRLEDLTLHVYLADPRQQDVDTERSTSALLADARALLCDAAARLKCVTLHYLPGEMRPAALQLLQALVERTLGGASIGPAVETLRLLLDVSSCEPHARLLNRQLGHMQFATVLPQMHRLRRLDVRAQPCECFMPRFDHLDGVRYQETSSLLGAIDPTLTPSLQVLGMYLWLWCTHRWMHSPSVQKLLLRNPRLHVDAGYLMCDPSVDSCRMCESSCHGFNQLWYEDKKVGFFSHESDECDLGLGHGDPGIQWVRVRHGERPPRGVEEDFFEEEDSEEDF